MNSVMVVRGGGACARSEGGSFTIMAGQRGAPGKNGSGSGSADTFIWQQPLALAVWTIPHNLDRYPSVAVTDGQGRQVVPDITYISKDIIQVTHGSPFAGAAYLN